MGVIKQSITLLMLVHSRCTAIVPVPLENCNSKALKLAKKANLDAIVCSPKEVSLVRRVFKKEIITPGIRLNSKTHDQKRVLTPKQALDEGSDYLVIGRPITQAINPLENLQRILDE